VPGVTDFPDPDAVGAALAGQDYLAGEGLAATVFLALRLQRPLFCEGAPGVGKTSLAHALAGVFGGELVRLQCYEGIESTQALYDWDFPRQLLHLRTVEALGGQHDPATTEHELYDRRFLQVRPVLRALETSTPDRPTVLLIDEIDRADDEFEAFLLEVLSDYTVTIPELGPVRAQAPPVVVITSNRTREVHDALKRRCLYHWLDLPDHDQEVAVLRRRLPDLPALLAEQVATAMARARAQDLLKPPGLAESLDWARSLQQLGVLELDAEAARRSLGAVAKHREDQATLTSYGLDRLVAPR
jgi:MoxR-like ATPase